MYKSEVLIFLKSFVDKNSGASNSIFTHYNLGTETVVTLDILKI